jgi:low affinity Fe/Cu permease
MWLFIFSYYVIKRAEFWYNKYFVYVHGTTVLYVFLLVYLIQNIFSPTTNDQDHQQQEEEEEVIF